MKILVINCGSSSLKYQVFNMENEDVLAKGAIERIGIEGSFLKHEPAGGEEVKIEKDVTDHKAAFKMVVDAITDEGHGVLKDLKEIEAVGHRVVHGGEEFSGSVIIDDDVMNALESCINLAPLHNPPNIYGIEASKANMPGVPQVGVFDTAFHQTMPKKAYLYGIPYEYYEKHSVRRYGFHGTSHKYVASRAADMLGKPLEDLKLITCHLGNGASVAAINKGESVDTSMGLTPLEGLVMGTRSGSMDPSIIKFLMDKEGLSIDEVDNILNKKSGVLGLSGLSNDFRDLEEAAAEGNERAENTLEVFYYTVSKYIGSYLAALNGADAIIFTAGLGENSPSVREAVTENLSYAGIKVDKDKNQVRGKETDISTDDASTRVLVVPTNEELMIAREAKGLLGK
ncbi:acetate/propionate family kinase [Natranaerobius thermophilus]|uniref:Acetate kinase n=1 Tax=Natranaerobius thermophilus (strain ATCC BAA-1301 / DSM 18059 / JW/NM-WN-LF) TaxID=457570 RepID=ACKA_NATTJ|nr:acetate kinase [Natranaerobius thermophilus]B2A8I5.1 RecName: Full=Acetate kinase; AltName: Full=Acetokinase [Natranaerobius thermophilus JW/NM-WN-LF]ACB85869.1 acetate kinase [Natranaerobius thermophilus JW/NM-WN-LF]